MNAIIYLTYADGLVKLHRWTSGTGEVLQEWNWKKLDSNQRKGVSLLAGEFVVVCRPHLSNGTFLYAKRESLAWSEDSYPDPKTARRTRNALPIPPKHLLVSSSKGTQVRELPDGHWEQVHLPAGFQATSLVLTSEAGIVYGGSATETRRENQTEADLAPAGSLAYFETNTKRIVRPLFRKTDRDRLSENDADEELLLFAMEHPLMAMTAIVVDGGIGTLILCQDAECWNTYAIPTFVAGAFGWSTGARTVVTTTAVGYQTKDHGRTWVEESLHTRMMAPLTPLQLTDINVESIGDAAGLIVAKVWLMGPKSAKGHSSIDGAALLASRDGGASFQLVDSIQGENQDILAYTVDEGVG